MNTSRSKNRSWGRSIAGTPQVYVSGDIQDNQSNRTHRQASLPEGYAATAAVTPNCPASEQTSTCGSAGVTGDVVADLPVRGGSGAATPRKRGRRLKAGSRPGLPPTYP
jgi:hypothetical protein